MAHVPNARAYHCLYDWSGSAHVQGLYTLPCMRSAYLVLSARTQALSPLPAANRDSEFFFFNLRFPMGGVKSNGLWAISPGLSVTSTIGRSRVRSKVRFQWPTRCN